MVEVLVSTSGMSQNCFCLGVRALCEHLHQEDHKST